MITKEYGACGIIPYGTTMRESHPEIMNLPKGDCFLLLEQSSQVKLCCMNGMRKDIYSIEEKDGKWWVNPVPVSQQIPVKSRKPRKFYLHPDSGKFEEVKLVNNDGPLPGVSVISVTEDLC